MQAPLDSKNCVFCRRWNIYMDIYRCIDGMPQLTRSGAFSVDLRHPQRLTLPTQQIPVFPYPNWPCIRHYLAAVLPTPNGSARRAARSRWRTVRFMARHSSSNYGIMYPTDGRRTYLSNCLHPDHRVDHAGDFSIIQNRKFIHIIDARQSCYDCNAARKATTLDHDRPVLDV